MRCYFTRTISFVDDFFKTYLDRQNRLSGDKGSPSLWENFIRNFFGGHIGMRSVYNADYLDAIVFSARLRRNANLCIHVHVAVYRWYGLLAGVSC
jgi:hypothetical protein